MCKIACETKSVVFGVNYSTPKMGKTKQKLFKGQQDFYHLIVKVFKSPQMFGIEKSKIAVAGGSGGAWIVMGAVRKLIEEGQENFVKLMILACPDISMHLGESHMTTTMAQNHQNQKV